MHQFYVSENTQVSGKIQFGYIYNMEKTNIKLDLR